MIETNTTGRPVINEWQLAVEQVVVPATTNGARTLGFTSPRAGAGVTSFARAVAETLARGGAEVLYVDLGSPLRKTGPVHARAAAQIWKEPVADRAGGFEIVSPAGTDARFHFNNVRWLRAEFARMLRTYSNIVVDLAPLLSDDVERVNALGAAAACDAVVMMCAREQLSQYDVGRALQLTSSTGVNLAGTVVNEMNYVSPGDEIAALLRRWCPHTKLAKYLGDKISGTELLR